MDEIICYCKQVTKSEILRAISEGAKTLKDIQKITDACTGSDCKKLNPSGKCCSSVINTLLPESKIKITPTCSCGHC